MSPDILETVFLSHLQVLKCGDPRLHGMRVPKLWYFSLNTNTCSWQNCAKYLYLLLKELCALTKPDNMFTPNLFSRSSRTQKKPGRPGPVVQVKQTAATSLNCPSTFRKKRFDTLFSLHCAFRVYIVGRRLASSAWQLQLDGSMVFIKGPI